LIWPTLSANAVRDKPLDSVGIFRCLRAAAKSPLHWLNGL
jgi:hypothetical protein